MTPPPLQITCKEFVELVTAYLDGVLSERDRVRFEAHNERCPGCRAYLSQFRQTIDALHSVPAETAEPLNLDELRGTFETKPRGGPRRRSDTGDAGNPGRRPTD